MSSIGEDYAAVYAERRVRARVSHRCCACRETIEPGHVYARIAIVFDGHAWTVKRCIRCQMIHEHLRTLGGRDVWPDEWLNCGEEYTAHWGTEPPPEIAALAFATADEMQRRVQ